MGTPVLIFPILFNYRHGLELAMKWIISRYAGYSSLRADGTETHDLWRLWQLCKGIIVELGSDDLAIRAVEQLVQDFAELDRSAQAFRYACDTTGGLIPLPVGWIDLHHLRDVMEGVHNFFTGADAQLDANCDSMGW